MMAVWKNVEALLQDIEKSLHEHLKNTPAADIHPALVHVLAELYQQDGQHASVLARAIGRQATSFTPLLDKLEGAGYIERRSDPEDRRAIRIYLKPMGIALKPHIQKALGKLEAEYPESGWKVGADEPAELIEA